MTKEITLTIDGKQVTVPQGTLIVDAAKKVGIDIPVFCYHPKMEPVGMCRMCLVDVGRPVVDRATGQPLLEADGTPRISFGGKLETACTTPVSEGMVVIGMSEKVQAARKDVVEFLLTSHPLDCPVCDKGGECPLQNLTMAHGVGESRFLFDEKHHAAKHVPLGDLIFLDRERCIQCGRCVRFQDEIVDDPVIGFYNRGRNLEIVTFSEPGFDSYFSGNTTDICPVGALTTADFRFGARPWEMKTTASICAQCPVGCNLAFNVRREARSGGEIVIKRTMPRQNEQVNEVWICDKGRFAYHFAESQERLTSPMIRRGGALEPVSWEEAIEFVAQALRDADQNLLALASGRLANEDLFNLRTLADAFGGKAALYTHMAGGDLTAQVGVGQGTNFADLGPGSVILVVASDLEEEAPIWWLRVKQAAQRGAALIVVNARPTKTERYASQVLRTAYGSEAATVLAMVNAISAKRPDLPGNVAVTAEMRAAAEVVKNAENAIVLFGSEGLGLEGSAALAQACANLLLVTNHTGRANNGLIGVWPRANEQGAWDMGLRPLPDLKAALADTKVLYVAAADPVGDDPALAEALADVHCLVVQELYLTETAKLADVVLPAQPFTEREGSFTSGERRVQRFYPAVPARPQSRPDFAITGEIAKKAGVDAEVDSAARVMNRIAERLPAYAGITYRGQAQVQEQWPIISRSDLYYGGTAYENTQGLGIQLAPTAQQGQTPALAWPQTPEIVLPEGSLLAVPVTILYDQGITVTTSPLLQSHVPQPYLAVCPAEAQRLKAAPGDQVTFSLGGQEISVTLRVDDNIPAGVALAPRSLGMPLSAPAAIQLRLAKKAQVSV